MSSNIHAHTPAVTVLDNRGLTVRTIDYHRHPETPDVTDERITRHQFDVRGHLIHSIDPRLFALQQQDKAVKPNVSYLTNLNGDVMRTESTDAGITVSLSDIAGRPHWSKNAVGALQAWEYEADTLPGRLLSVTEQPQGESARITERFVYAGNSEKEKAYNLAGQAVRHYDTAGLTQTDSLALTGTPLAVTRQLLPEGTPADWQGTQESAWQARLSPDMFTTHSTADATGATLTHTDAKGHQQRLTYDVAGLLTESGLTLKGQPEQIILKSLTWSAAGQKLSEAHGNGVVTTYRYEPETQRLTAIKTERPTGHAAGVKVLQDLRYTYDPVGNVLRILDEAEPTRFWRNQKVVPENTYTYDSLYQLVKATGREKADIKNQGISPTAVSIPLATDNTAYTAWTRRYTYDTGNNLTRIRHHAPASGNTYTTEITVSHRSNRAVLSKLTTNPTKVDSLFDAGGHQMQLQPGQSLTWTARGELLNVMPVMRDEQAADTESYRYDANSQRVIKTTVQQTGNSRQTQRVVYLPNLELRTTQRGETLKEVLQVITVGEAGRAQVRVLHWEAGKPDGINNNQLRYSYDNLIGSSTLELDGMGEIISQEEYYPYGGTAVWTARNQTEADYKTRRYSGKERDATGLYYYGYRYYQPWVGRWLSADPANTVDGLNLYRMVENNPIIFHDAKGLIGLKRSISAPELRVPEYKAPGNFTFIGYHGTSKQHATNIINKGLDIDKIPLGQIGQGFYIAKGRWLSEGSSQQAPDSAKSDKEREYKKMGLSDKIKTAYLTNMSKISLSSLTEYSSFNEIKKMISQKSVNEETASLLKIYTSMPLKHTKWSSMLFPNYSDNLSMLRIMLSEEKTKEGKNIVLQNYFNAHRKNLQMVIHKEDMHKLIVTKDDGVNESAKWPARESHAMMWTGDLPSHPDNPIIDNRKEDYYSNRRKEFNDSDIANDFKIIQFKKITSEYLRDLVNEKSFFSRIMNL